MFHVVHGHGERGRCLHVKVVTCSSLCTFEELSRQVQLHQQGGMDAGLVHEAVAIIADRLKCGAGQKGEAEEALQKCRCSFGESGSHRNTD